MGKLDGFGAALKSLRRAQEEGGKPLTLQALERRTGIHYTNISGYEKEQEWPSRATLERLLDGLGVSFIDLAVETERQCRIAAGESPGLPPPGRIDAPVSEERVREIVRQEFGSGLRGLAGLTSNQIDILTRTVREGGGEPDLEALAVLQWILERRGETGA